MGRAREMERERGEGEERKRERERESCLSSSKERTLLNQMLKNRFFLKTLLLLNI